MIMIYSRLLDLCLALVIVNCDEQENDTENSCASFSSKKIFR